MNMETIIQNYRNKGYVVTYFETGAQAAEYLNKEMKLLLVTV